jgi:hypothetical protein
LIQIVEEGMRMEREDPMVRMVAEGALSRVRDVSLHAEACSETFLKTFSINETILKRFEGFETKTVSF